jgi:tRNA-intron endonuclease
MLLTSSRGWGHISDTSPSTGSDVKECPKGRAYLIGSKVVVFDVDVAKCLFSTGFFGKPLGIRKPKTLDISEPIELSLLEAIYLIEKDVIEVYEDNRKVSKEELLNLAKKRVDEAEILYRVFKEFRDRGLIVRSALKYGADFAVYRKRPGLEHAPFLVKVLKYNENVDPGDLIGWGRLSHSVRKMLLLAVTYPGGESKYIMFKWLRP